MCVRAPTWQRSGRPVKHVPIMRNTMNRSYGSKPSQRPLSAGDRSPSPAARLAACLVQLYQWTLSPLKQVLFGCYCACRFQPTCSCYARSALLHYGCWRGGWYALRRILRCHPWHPGGYDPLPDFNQTDKEENSTALTTFLDG